MTTTVTVKGQVTLPKQARDAAGIKPGDKVEVRATASGAIIIEKPAQRFEEQLRALAKRRLVKGMSTDEFMEMTRGEISDLPEK
jgi:AbrB family looped-hinge helix DNA binding protein